MGSGRWQNSPPCSNKTELLPLEKQGNKSTNRKAAIQARNPAFSKKRAAGQIKVSMDLIPRLAIRKQSDLKNNFSVKAVCSRKASTHDLNTSHYDNGLSFILFTVSSHSCIYKLMPHFILCFISSFGSYCICLC